MKSTSVMALGASIMLFAACAHEETAKVAASPLEQAPSAPSQTPVPTNPAMENGPTSADVPREGPNADTNTGSMERQSVASMSDGQLLQITHVANVGEIDQAKLALTRSKDQRVRSLAQMIVRDHTQADEKAMALAKKENIDREPSPVSAQVASDGENATASLKADPAADFDKGYVDTQVKEHESVLEMLDEKLILNATNHALKSYLMEVRAAVASHLQHAKELQSELVAR